MTALTLSGGYDSAAAAIKMLERGEMFDLIFINYNQNYLGNELKAAQDFADRFDIELIILKLNLKHDMKRRNFHFVVSLAAMGYDRIVLGCRNILPMLDKYKDSNWLSLKCLAWLMGIEIVLPVVGYSKKRIFNVLRNYDLELYNCYYNNVDPYFCECQNCVEIRELLK